jgi:cell wall-associated NlpC family hydrolase
MNAVSPMAGAPEWCAGYIGFPYRKHGRDRGGLDCWGLNRLLARERLGIDLPEHATGYEGVGRADAADIVRLLTHGKADWVEVCPKAETGPDAWRAWFDRAEPLLIEGDFLEVRFFGDQRCHVAYYVAPGWALHALEGMQTSLMKYRDALWRHKVTGFYRHRSRLAAHPIA